MYIDCVKCDVYRCFRVIVSLDIMRVGPTFVLSFVRCSLKPVLELIGLYLFDHRLTLDLWIIY